MAGLQPNMVPVQLLEPPDTSANNLEIVCEADAAAFVLPPNINEEMQPSTPPGDLESLPEHEMETNAVGQPMELPSMSASPAIDSIPVPSPEFEPEDERDSNSPDLFCPSGQPLAPIKIPVASPSSVLLQPGNSRESGTLAAAFVPPLPPGPGPRLPSTPPGFLEYRAEYLNEASSFARPSPPLERDMWAGMPSTSRRGAPHFDAILAACPWREYSTYEGMLYYYNRETNDSTWKMPKQLRDIKQAILDYEANGEAAMHDVPMDEIPLPENPHDEHWVADVDPAVANIPLPVGPPPEEAMWFANGPAVDANMEHQHVFGFMDEEEMWDNIEELVEHGMDLEPFDCLQPGCDCCDVSLVVYVRMRTTGDNEEPEMDLNRMLEPEPLEDSLDALENLTPQELRRIQKIGEIFSSALSQIATEIVLD